MNNSQVEKKNIWIATLLQSDQCSAFRWNINVCVKTLFYSPLRNPICLGEINKCTWFYKSGASFPSVSTPFPSFSLWLPSKMAFLSQFPTHFYIRVPPRSPLMSNFYLTNQKCSYSTHIFESTGEEIPHSSSHLLSVCVWCVLCRLWR